jgi:hypothetical protein
MVQEEMSVHLQALSVGRFVNSSMYIKAVIEVFLLGIVNGPGLG